MQERYIKEKAPEGAAAELGGGWFEGLADGVKKQPSTVKYENMAGRSDGEASPSEEAEEVIIEVRNWKPHLPVDVGVTKWADPQTVPRFLPDKKDILTEKAVVLAPKFDLVTARSGGIVQFDKQTGREAKEEEDELMLEMDGLGAGDQGMAMDAAEDGDARRRRGFEASSTSKRVVVAVNMDTQTKRKEISRPSAAPDVVYDVKYAIMEDRTGKGVRSWAKEVDFVDAANGDGALPEVEEEVILDPQHHKQSKYVLLGVII